MKIIKSKSFFKQADGWTNVPNLDKEQYPSRPGLEVPFRLKSGKVVYYDSREGKYYDASTDMYLSEEEYQAHNQERPNPHKVVASVDEEHKRAFPDQYSHPLCEKKIRVKQVGETGASGNAAQSPIIGVVKRVVNSRFGQIAMIETSSGEKANYLLSDIVRI